MITLAFDSETFAESGIKKDAVNRHKAKIFSYSTCDEKGKYKIVRDTDSDFASYLDELVFSGNYKLVIHNAKFDLGMLQEHYKDDLRSFKFEFEDTLLAFKVFYSNHYSHALDDLAYDLCRYPKVQDTKISEWLKGKRNITYRDVPQELMHDYQKHDGIRGILLWRFAEKRLKENAQFQETYEWEKKLIIPTIEMENYGSRICPIKSQELIEKMTNNMTETLKKISDVCGEEIKPGTKKWKDLLITLGIDSEEKTDTGAIKLDKHLMLKIRNGISDENKKHFKNLDKVEDITKLADLQLRYKSYQLAKSTLTSYLNIKDNENVLHPNIITCQADTGRESCTAPNLQNVQKSTSLLNPYATPMRSIFICRDGRFNIHIDYSGQEKRLLVHYSQEEELIKIINDKGDMHLPSCEEFFGERFKNADPKEKKSLRDASKNGGFLIDYGGEVDKLAQTLNLPLEEAQGAIDRYRARFKKLAALLPTLARQVKYRGCIYTAFKRQLLLPRNQGHKGINYLIQGTAAEQIKRAQVRIYGFLKSVQSEIKMILPIHDEIVFDCATDYPLRVEHFKKICEIMVDFGDTFSVPFEVEMSITRDSWDKKSKVNVNDI